MNLPNDLHLDIQTPLPNGGNLQLMASSYAVKGTERSLSALFAVNGQLQDQHDHLYMTAIHNGSLVETGFFVPRNMGRLAWNGVGKVPTCDELVGPELASEHTKTTGRLEPYYNVDSTCIPRDFYESDYLLTPSFMLSDALGRQTDTLPEPMRDIQGAVVSIANLMHYYVRQASIKVDTVNPHAEIDFGSYFGSGIEA